MVVDFDDFGANHVISDQCQSHDCRDKLVELKNINPAFKVTLFAIPAEMTWELVQWCRENKDWVEVAIHGFNHSSNYEAQEWTPQRMFDVMQFVALHFGGTTFINGFKAPGWQISDGCYEALEKYGWWVADQDYNTKRRPEGLKAYINRNGEFFAHKAQKKILTDGYADWEPVEAWHGHTWDCVGNGIYETFDELSKVVKDTEEFKFVSEVVS